MYIILAVKIANEIVKTRKSRKQSPLVQVKLARKLRTSVLYCEYQLVPYKQEYVYCVNVPLFSKLKRTFGTPPPSDSRLAVDFVVNVPPPAGADEAAAVKVGRREVGEYLRREKLGRRTK